MQEKSKDTPKLKRVRRVHNANTSEVMGKSLLNATSNIRPATTTSRSRATMLPGDIMQLQKLPKRRIVANRQSVMPALPLDAQKKADYETKELELELLFNEYLQTIMMDHIIKKKTESKKQLIVAQLATISQEIDQDMRKLIKIKTRDRDINLSLAQKEIDVQISAVAKHTKSETFKTVKNMLSKLQLLLEPLDVLRCNDIILPKTQDEWKETQEALAKCLITLKDVTSLIGSKGETYCTVSDGLKTFTEIYSQVESLQKKLEEALCNLQILILKNASFSLTQSEINK